MQGSRVAAGAVGVALLLGGCGEGAVGPEADVQIQVEGRLERGSSVRMDLVRNGARVSAERVDWTFAPSSSLEVLGGGLVKLREEGEVRVEARFEDVSSSRGLDVARPPAVVFEMVRDGNRDIYTATLDGEDVERLTTHPLDDSDPTAEGERVVFVSYRGGSANLYSVTRSSAEVARLTETDESEGDPALARGGRELAFTRTEGGSPKLMILDLATGAIERAASAHGFSAAIEASPAWSRSRGPLAFVSTADGPASIFQLDLRSGDAEPLVSSGSGEFDPAWSPDGRFLAFASDRTGDNELYLLTVATSEVRRLTHRPGSDGQPAWLPDGRIVFTSWTGEVPGLRWLDPADPDDVHEIPTGGDPAMNPAILP